MKSGALSCVDMPNIECKHKCKASSTAEKSLNFREKWIEEKVYVFVAEL